MELSLDFVAMALLRLSLGHVRKGASSGGGRAVAGLGEVPGQGLNAQPPWGVCVVVSFAVKLGKAAALQDTEPHRPVGAAPIVWLPR